jgi:phosphomannomutase
MQTMRTAPPLVVGEFFVDQVVDLATGYQDLPPTDGILLQLSGQNEVKTARIIVRPSGTEPKVKVYIQLVVQVKEDVAVARRIGENKVATVRAILEDYLAN